MQLDHFNIRTRKVEETIRFYERLIGLEPGYRPPLSVGGVWLYSGNTALLHIIDGPETSLATGPLDHVAFSSIGLSTFLHRMDEAGISRVVRRIPDTSVVQVQFLDPNRVMIEVNFTGEPFDGDDDSGKPSAHAILAQREADRSRSVRVVGAKEIKTTYETCGAGPVLVLVHGAHADRHSFAPIIPFLSQHFTCVTYDQRDSGDTTNPASSYSIADLADDAAGLIASFGPRAHVWGTSFGGTIAQELAIRHPDCVDGLVLSVTYQCGANALADPEMFRALRARALTDQSARSELVSLFFSPSTTEQRPDRVAALEKALTPREPDAAARRTAASQAFNSKGRVSAIKSRTLVLGAMEDRVIDPINSWNIASEIPDATLTMLSGMGHAVTYEDADRVARVITNYLLR